MTKKVFTSALLAVIPAIALSVAVPVAKAQPPQQVYLGFGAGQGPWDAPPAEFDDLRRRAFHDGIDAARWDAEHGRRMDFDDSRNFRRPPVPRGLRDQYRAGFSRGYQVAAHRMMEMRDHHERDWGHDHDHWPR